MGGSDICETNTFSGIATFQDKYTQNVKVVNEYLEQFGNQRLPVMLSETIVDNSGCTLPDQTIEAFYVSVKHANAFMVNIICAM
eukprot:12946377-Heterocapsa_arctica.AAC.1